MDKLKLPLIGLGQREFRLYCMAFPDFTDGKWILRDDEFAS